MLLVMFKYCVVQVYANGLISFDETRRPHYYYNNSFSFPREFDRYRLIAPFWTYYRYLYIRGMVWYRESSSEADFERAEREIRNAYPGEADSFTPQIVFIATWEEVNTEYYYNRQAVSPAIIVCIIIM